jgi:hypothetical protein
LKEEHEEEQHKIGARVILESFISRTIPTKETDRREEKRVKNTQEKCYKVSLMEHYKHSTNHIDAHNAGIKDPQMIQVSNNLLKL